MRMIVKGKMLTFALAMMLMGCNSAEQKKGNDGSQVKVDTTMVEVVLAEDTSACADSDAPLDVVGRYECEQIVE